MTLAANLRCLNHENREAVAQCRECGSTFCRECISEHEDRVICAACLEKHLADETPGRKRLTGMIQLVQLAVGLLLAWAMFTMIGWCLLQIPTDFHEGSVWKESRPEE